MAGPMKIDPGRVGIWGASGSGKSTFVKASIRSAQRVVVLDPMEEYGAAGFVTVRSVAEVKAAMAASFARFRLALVPAGGREAATLDRLSILLRYAQEPYRDGVFNGRVLLVVEEMNTSFAVHGGDARAPNFADLCSRGRHYGVGLVGASQRIAEVNTRFRGNCSETVVFRQAGKVDLKAAADALGFVDQAEIRALANHSYIRLKGGKLGTGRNSLRA